MNNYDIYNLIVEELEDRVDSGEITLEFAESVNDLAYERYVSESEYIANKKRADVINADLRYLKQGFNEMKKQSKYIKNKEDAHVVKENAKECKKYIKKIRQKISDSDTMNDSKSSNERFNSLILTFGGIVETALSTAILINDVKGLNIDIKENDEKIKYGGYPESNREIISRNVKGSLPELAFTAFSSAVGLLGIKKLLSLKKCNTNDMIKTLDNLNDFCDEVIQKMDKMFK